MRGVFRGAVVFSLGFWANELLRHLEIRAGYMPTLLHRRNAA